MEILLLVWAMGLSEIFLNNYINPIVQRFPTRPTSIQVYAFVMGQENADRYVSTRLERGPMESTRYKQKTLISAKEAQFSRF